MFIIKIIYIVKNNKARARTNILFVRAQLFAVV